VNKWLTMGERIRSEWQQPADGARSRVVIGPLSSDNYPCASATIIPPLPQKKLVVVISFFLVLFLSCEICEVL
jgi:hypothetical protein